MLSVKIAIDENLQVIFIIAMGSLYYFLQGYNYLRILSCSFHKNDRCLCQNRCIRQTVWELQKKKWKKIHLLESLLK